MDEYVPLSRAADGTITTQFTMTTLEELGLLKMDFLGLRTLTVIQNAVQLAEKRLRHQSGHDEYRLLMIKNVLECIGTGKYRRRVPAGKRRYEKLHEGAEAGEPGRYHRRDFPVPSRSYGFHPTVYLKGKE